MTNQIEQKILLKATPARVWRALSDHREFGAWFRVNLPKPFAIGTRAQGFFTIPGCEDVLFNAMVTVLEPERRFAFTWHPYAIDPAVDYEAEPTTLVEFRLQPVEGGTLVTVTESGFDAIPEGRRMEAFRMNERGWTQQIGNLLRHVDAAAAA